MSVVGSVAGLWRFPVKSMRGEQLAQARLGARGILGDRAYALIDEQTDEVVSAKSVKLFPDLLQCSAAFVTPPRVEDELPPVRITFQGGASVTSDHADVDRALSAHLGREVRLARVKPADPSPPAQGHLAALFAAAGVESPLPNASYFDAFPLSVLTLSSLARLRELEPEAHFEEPRFRMNVIVDTPLPGFAENEWPGRVLGLGDGARLRVVLPGPRCVMTTLAQGSLPEDRRVLRTLARHNSAQIGELGKLPCAGVYGVLDAPGTVRVGDQVDLG